MSGCPGLWARSVGRGSLGACLVVAAAASAAVDPRAAEADAALASRGFVYLGTGPADSAALPAGETGQRRYYAKVIEPRRRVELLSAPDPAPAGGARHAVSGFEVDCANGALRYVAARFLDAEGNLASREVRLRKVAVLQRPSPDGFPARALRLACG